MKKLCELTAEELYESLKPWIRRDFGFDDIISYKTACDIFNISSNHLHYQVAAGRITSFKKKGKSYVIKRDLDRLLQCNMLIFKK